VLVTGPNSRFGSGTGSYPEPNRCNGFPHKTRPFNITTLPPIKYLSSDRIMMWSVCRLCSSSRSCSSRSPICDPTNIRWVAIENLLISHIFALFFHSHSTNISRIANRNARGERAARTAQFTYWSYHDMIRTQISSLSQRFRNHKMEPRSGSNPSPNLVGSPVFRVTTWTGHSGPVPNPDRSRVTRNRC